MYSRLFETIRDYRVEWIPLPWRVVAGVTGCWYRHLLLAALFLFALPAPAAAQSPCGDTTPVIFGDTLHQIAERCEVTINALLRANPEIRDPSQVRIGQILVVPSAEDVTEPIRYTIRTGDSLLSIAQRYNTTLTAILNANPSISNPSSIFVGQSILIPLSEQEPAVIIESDVGSPGTTMEVRAIAFPPDTEVIVGIGEASVEPVDTFLASTDANGTLVTEVTVPASARPNERWTVVVYEPGEGGARDNSRAFLVNSPDPNTEESATLPTQPRNDEVRVTLTPRNGPPGTEVEVRVSGLIFNELVDVGIGRTTMNYETVEEDLRAGGPLGQVHTTVLIPESAIPGETWQMIVAQDAGPDRYTARFRITEPGSAVEDAEVTISPVRGAPGTTVQISATGLPTDTMVEIGAGRVNTEYDIVATGQSDPDGRILRTVRIPQLAEEGESWVVSVTPVTSGATYVSNTFLVTERSDTAGQGLASTNIYLVALEDNGRSGIQIGCNDSVVPVEVEIEPSPRGQPAVLTSALKRLVSLDERMHGESGLYNALYRSDLSVDRVTIERGEARIELTGDLLIGGVCDEPRVEAQLRQTALQYYTVNSVTMTINGEPLAEVLRQ